MAEVPRSLLNDLSTQVGRLSLTAKTQVATILDQVIAAWDGTAPADLRNAVIQVFQTVMPAYTDLAAALASDFYDTVRQLQGAVGTYRPTVWSGHSAEADEGAIRALLDSVIKSGDVQRFRGDLLDRVDAEIRRSANRCIDYNSGRDPARPSWALVPSGDETCGFCLLLASFGFQYDQPVHGHGNCDCRAVPSFGGGTVEGYDPDGMYGRYQDCLDALGGRDGIWGDWQALSEEERAAYIQRHGGNSSEAYEAYVRNRVAAEIESRGPEWFKGSSNTGDSWGTAKSDSVIFTDHQIGIKLGKHASDWGLNPASAIDREEFTRITKDIIDNAEQITYGAWRGQIGICEFYRKGEDVVIVNKTFGEYVTTMRGGASNANYLRTIADSRD